jgi:hypothetical protein
MEPVEVGETLSSSVEALGTRTEDTEEEGAATVVGVSLTLAASREVIPLSREPEAGREGTANGPAICALEVVTTARDGGGIAVIGDTLAKCCQWQSQGSSSEDGDFRVYV